MARLIRRVLGWIVFLGLIGGGYWLVRDYARRYPQHVPWTELDLSDPVGRFTGRKLATLYRKPGQCRRLLASAGSRDSPVVPRRDSPDCGYDNGMLIAGDRVSYVPAGLVASCPVAAAMHLLEEQVIQPAAMRRFGARVVLIEHFGSYSCRRLYGREEGDFSEHATANAVDIAGFRLDDGTQIRVGRNWHSGGPKAAFLRDVRDGACRLFATVLSPDYNTAHADHLHLDQAQRGEFGWRLCR